MDLNLIKKKLEALTNQQQATQGASVFFKPTVGKQIIRIAPAKGNKDLPFYEFKMYFEIGSKKVIASPLNWGDKDPIAEFVKSLRQSGDKENYYLSRKIEARNRIFAPVIVRGQEEEGVKLWQFGKETYQDLLSMAEDPEIGDYTDIMNGRDIKLNTVGPEATGTSYNKTSVSPSLKVSPLADTEETIQKFLTDQPSPLELFHRFTYDEIKEELQLWLSNDENTKVDIQPKATTSSTTAGQPGSNYVMNESDKKVTPSKKFDDLFNDEI